MKKNLVLQSVLTCILVSLSFSVIAFSEDEVLEEDLMRSEEVMTLEEISSLEEEEALEELMLSEEIASNGLDDFLNWYYENDQSGGEYVLTEDLIIENNLFLEQPKMSKPITIVANDHHIIIKGRVTIQKSKISIIGEGGSEGLIQVIDGGRLQLYEQGSITANNGTAIRVEKDSWLSIDGWDLLEINAKGENARGIESESSYIEITRAVIYASGTDAIGMEIKINQEEQMRIREEYQCLLSKISAEGENAKSIVLEDENCKTLLLDTTEVDPGIEGNFSIEVIKRTLHISENFKKNQIHVVSKGEVFENIPIRHYEDMVLRNESTGENIVESIKIIWNEEEYKEKIRAGETNFEITGVFYDYVNQDILNLQKEVIVPTSIIIVRDPAPIDDLYGEIEEEEDYDSMAKLTFSMPYSAQQVLLERSKDGVEWKKIVDLSAAVSSEAYIEQWVLFGENKAYFYRVNVIGSTFAGYSNVIYLSTIEGDGGESIPGGGNGSNSNDDEEDTSGGNRGSGGSRDEAVRVPEEPIEIGEAVSKEGIDNQENMAIIEEPVIEEVIEEIKAVEDPVALFEKKEEKKSVQAWKSSPKSREKVEQQQETTKIGAIIQEDKGTIVEENQTQVKPEKEIEPDIKKASIKTKLMVVFQWMQNMIQWFTEYIKGIVQLF